MGTDLKGFYGFLNELVESHRLMLSNISQENVKHWRKGDKGFITSRQKQFGLDMKWVLEEVDKLDKKFFDFVLSVEGIVWRNKKAYRLYLRLKRLFFRRNMGSMEFLFDWWKEIDDIVQTVKELLVLLYKGLENFGSLLRVAYDSMLLRIEMKRWDVKINPKGEVSGLVLDMCGLDIDTEVSQLHRVVNNRLLLNIETSHKIKEEVEMVRASLKNSLERLGVSYEHNLFE